MLFNYIILIVICVTLFFIYCFPPGLKMCLLNFITRMTSWKLEEVSECHFRSVFDKLAFVNYRNEPPPSEAQYFILVDVGFVYQRKNALQTNTYCQCQTF